jgi:hypothetical protein
MCPLGIRIMIQTLRKDSHITNLTAKVLNVKYILSNNILKHMHELKVIRTIVPVLVTRDTKLYVRSSQFSLLGILSYTYDRPSSRY